MSERPCTCLHDQAAHVDSTGGCDFLNCPCFRFVAETYPPERLKLYADAMHQAHWDVRDARQHALGSYNAAKVMARAMMPVADAELAEQRLQLFADVASLMNDRADMYEREGDRPCEAAECRMLANAFRTYAEGVGVPSMDSLRQKRREAEQRVAAVQKMVAEMEQDDAVHLNTYGQHLPGSVGHIAERLREALR